MDGGAGDRGEEGVGGAGEEGDGVKAGQVLVLGVVDDEGLRVNGTMTARALKGTNGTHQLNGGTLLGRIRHDGRREEGKEGEGAEGGERKGKKVNVIPGHGGERTGGRIVRGHCERGKRGVEVEEEEEEGGRRGEGERKRAAEWEHACSPTRTGAVLGPPLVQSQPPFLGPRVGRTTTDPVVEPSSSKPSSLQSPSSTS